MYKKINFLSFLLTAVMILGLFPAYAAADSYDVYTKASFDDLALDNAGTESSASYSYKADKGNVALNWGKGREINSVAAPSPETKFDGTSFTKNGAVDKALQFNVTSGNTGSNYINISIGGSDLYAKEKLIFSMNVFVESYGYKGYLNADLRDTNSKKINNLFRFNNGGKIITFEDNNTPATSINRPNQKWFHIKFEFDPKEKTYDLYLDDVKQTESPEKIHTDDLCFSGDPDASKTAIGVLRLQMVSTNDTSYAKFYVDDIYFGEPIVEEPEPVTPGTPSGKLETFNQSNFDNFEFDSGPTLN